MKQKPVAKVVVIIDGIDRLLTLDEAIDITVHWKKKNKRRCSLIDKEFSYPPTPLTTEEEKELEYLQTLHGYRRHLYCPLHKLLVDFEEVTELLRRNKASNDSNW
ncbi:MAG: hypothetical protein KBC21_03770 [Candidatus Pacebacteria bacterium]|nr:hypothetical protein [Candidatus Paceibacterota bacterium]